MQHFFSRLSFVIFLLLGWIFVPLSWAWANIATPTVLQPSWGPINTPLPALITQSLVVCGSEEVSVGYVLSGSEYKMKCMSIADIRTALGISTAPLTCWRGQIAKGISDDKMALQCRYFPPGCWLTQAMADDLNKYSWQSNTIEKWCETKTLTLYGNWWSWTNPVDGKIHLPNGVRKLTQLTTLNIHNYPVEVIDPWIANFTDLENLAIFSSKLESLPPSLGSFSKLKKLIISGYGTKAPITTVPDDIVNLTSLEKLTINYTNITQLPPNFEKLNKLTSLSLQNNNLTALPSNIGNITGLVGSVCDTTNINLNCHTQYSSYYTNKYLFFWAKCRFTAV